jgi:thymidylate synthase (FAD)
MSAELLSHFGNDEMVVNAARVSYNKDASNYTNEKNKRLIKFLVEHKHTAPFRHPQLQFRITCPIYVERQLFKHQVGMSANSISGRYVDFSDSYSRIDIWRKQSTSSKQGSAGLIEEASQDFCSIIEKKVIETCRDAYEQLIEVGVSKEQARTILPLNLNTTFIWTGSMLSFIYFWNLRLKEDTQQETRELAQEMLDLVKNIEGDPFVDTIKAFKL